MTHDPLCPKARWPQDEDCYECLLIARVRQDQNQANTKMRTVFHEQGLREGYAEALRDAVAALKGAMPDEDEGWEKSIAAAWMRHAIAAIEALGGER